MEQTSYPQAGGGALTAETTAAPARPRRRLVLGARTALLMLLVAGLVVLGLGAASLLLADPPEVGGWLRSIFGRVFGVVAVGLAFVLGVPAAVGLWAMSGATADTAIPALSKPTRRAIGAVAIAIIAATILVCLTNGHGPAILDVGLIGLVAVSSLGLAGAAASSPHRGRAFLSALALLAVVVGAAWVLAKAFLGVGAT